MRVELDHASGIGAVTTAVSDAGGARDGSRFVEPNEGRMIIDLTCNASTMDTLRLLRTAVEAVDGRTSWP